MGLITMFFLSQTNKAVVATPGIRMNEACRFYFAASLQKTKTGALG
jgi:hypothetical protein